MVEFEALLYCSALSVLFFSDSLLKSIFKICKWKIEIFPGFFLFIWRATQDLALFVVLETFFQYILLR